MHGAFTAHRREALKTTRAEAFRLGHPFVGPEQTDQGGLSRGGRAGFEQSTMLGPTQRNDYLGWINRAKQMDT